VNKYIKRLAARKSAIIDWLNTHEQTDILSSTENMLLSLDKNQLFERYYEGMKKGLDYCSNIPEARCLDFSWYYGGRETGEALAYAYDGIKTKGTLSKSDLGPEGLSGIEIKADMDNMIAEYFAAIPLHIALNHYTTEIKPYAEKISPEVVVLSLELINLWNYSLAIESLSKCAANYNDNCFSNDKFWITLTRHERSSIPIGSFN